MQQKPINKRKFESFQEIHSCIEELISIGDFEGIEFIIGINAYILVEKQGDKDLTFKLYERILKSIEVSTEPNHSLKAKVITGLGVICDNMGLAKEALSVYLLGLLSSEGKQDFLFYNNIGVCFADLLDYNHAKLFYKKAINSNSYGISETQKKANRIYNLAITNLSITYTKLGDIQQAKEQLKMVDASSSKIVDDYYIYANWLVEVESFGKNYKEAIQYIEEIENEHSDNIFTYTYYLRQHLLQKELEIPIQEQFSILKSCFDKHEKVNNLSDKKETILDLIKVSKILGRKKEEEKFKNALFEISLLEVNKNTNANRIIIEEYLLFFNKLSQSNKKIKHQNEELAKLSFLLSHNLKTPIRNISGFMELVRKKLKVSKHEKMNGHIDQVIDSCAELYDLLDNINQFVQFDEKTEPLTKLNLNSIIQEIETDLKNKFQLPIKIQCIDQMPTIWGRMTDFKNLFEIIITNGLKMNGTSKPSITIEHKTQADKLAFLIKDNGTGIKKEDQTSMFNFFDESSDSNLMKRTRMNFRMANKIIDYYNGTLYLKETNKNGSTFYFDIPAEILNAGPKKMLV